MFTSKSGNPTIVGITLVPDAKDVNVQRWTVVSISRNYPQAISGTQQADIKKQLDERYGKFSERRGRQRGITSFYGIHNDPLLKGSYGFHLSLFQEARADRYRMNSACGGDKKISID